MYNYNYNNRINFNDSSSNNKLGKTVNDIFNIGKTGYNTYNMFQSGGGSPWSLIPNVLNMGSTALKGGSFKNDVPQSFFGIDSENDSDVMQGLKGTANGAMTGATIGSIVPGIGTAIGAVIGGALGLGSSFLDDI